jgi:poly(hydroxyalkanoate) depolymerase family esterase
LAGRDDDRPKDFWKESKGCSKRQNGKSDVLKKFKEEKMEKGKISKLVSGLFLIFLVVLCVTKNGFSYDGGLNQSNLIGTKAVNVPITQVSSFGSNPGNLKMFVYVPSGLSNAPLVVALHGCTQTAQVYANDTMWSDLANQYKFAVLFPQQDPSNNQSKCFNWFEPGDTTRDSGEAMSIKQMVDKMKSSYSIDANRIYVTGLSAGAFMTVVMASTYPEIFKGAAPMAGGPYKCAATMSDAFSCMSGVDKTGAQWATLIKGGYPGYTGKYPIISIWQGTSDTTVKPMNAVELMQGWANVLGLSESPSSQETIQGNTHKVFKDSSGVALMETWDIPGMPHGITVDSDGTNGKPGGQTDTYSFDKNVWSSYEVAKFFGLVGFVPPPLCPGDYKQPVITLKKSPEGKIDIEIKVGSEPIDPGATADSERYGDLTPKIERTGHVDQNKPGIYEWRYNVADTEGCKAKEEVRKVIVKDGAPCKEWSDTLSNHENAGRVYSKSWLFWKNYYAKGTDTYVAGFWWSTVTLYEKSGEPGKYYLSCPE